MTKKMNWRTRTYQDPIINIRYQTRSNWVAVRQISWGEWTRSFAHRQKIKGVLKPNQYPHFWSSRPRTLQNDARSPNLLESTSCWSNCNESIETCSLSINSNWGNRPKGRVEIRVSICDKELWARLHAMETRSTMLVKALVNNLGTCAGV